MTPSVAFIQRRIPHYREAFFADLHDHLDQRGIALDVIVGDPDANLSPLDPRYPWLSTVTGRRLAVGGREVIWQSTWRATAPHDLIITELATRIISNLTLIARARFGGPQVCAFGHGRNFAKTLIPGPRSAHARLARSVDWWFAYNDLSRTTVIALGFPPERITAVNNTIDGQELRESVADHRRRGTISLRRRLGVAGTPVALFCGSLQPHKRLDFLFDAALRLRQRFPRLALLVLGDGQCEGAVKAFAHAHDWVHYVGRVVGGERAKYFAIADVMLLPGAVGLVVIDCFAAEVPLVTTDLPFHGPEIDYLRHGENGWLCTNNVDAYVDDVSRLLDDDQLRRQLRQGCAEAADRYPLKQMVTRFSDGILGALEARHRG